ncbi:MAG: twin-arginine translocase TatA/TatE family subunit [Firmicutes bacterium]|nr:twin-arginine translocase TatA/TatE family subunit [Bacillota bacterium]
MLRNLGVGEILLIVLAIILIFGANKLPQLGRSVGDSIRGFKRGLKDDEEEEPAKK